MNISIKHINKLIFLFLINLLFTSHINAAECSILKLQSNRSSGINVKTNECSALPDIALGSVIEISAKGRLWLKSTYGKENGTGFQLICQNRTSDAIQVEFSDTQSPWLSQTKLSNCNNWAKNKLICDGNNGEKKGLYCALSLNKLAKKKTDNVERTTSVKMRSMIPFSKQAKNTDKKNNKEQILAKIAPDLKLCKALSSETTKAKISWNVEQNAKSHGINILSTTGLQETFLSECVKTVVTTFNYPQLAEKITLNSSF